MSLVKGTNSYVDLSDANTYFGDRLDNSWTAASELRKSQALVTAAKLLDEKSWTGTIASESQPLAFPRVGTYFDPRAGTSLYLDGVSVPQRIMNAQLELANHLLSNEGLLDDSGSVIDLEVSSIKLTSVRAPSKIPKMVSNLIRPLLVNQGSSAWWRAW